MSGSSNRARSPTAANGWSLISHATRGETAVFRTQAPSESIVDFLDVRSRSGDWDESEVRGLVLSAGYTVLYGISGGSIVTDVPPAAAAQLRATGFRPVTFWRTEGTVEPAPGLLENSTAPGERADSVALQTERNIEFLFRTAIEEEFEDGVETEFSRRLVALVSNFGNAAVEFVHYLVGNNKVNAGVASEAFRWLGRMEHVPTHGWRRWVLQEGLTSSSIRVRDGAVLGLASMDDPETIPYIEDAIEREKCCGLREDMQQVLAQLEETGRCQCS